MGKTKVAGDTRAESEKPLKFTMGGSRSYMSTPFDDVYVNPVTPIAKRMNIQNEATGKMQNATIVSADSPAFFKASYKSNREYFEACGYTHKPQARAKTADERHRLAAGLPEGGRPGLWQKMFDSKQQYNSKALVSKDVPTWFQDPFVSNQEHFEKHGMEVEPMKEIRIPNPKKGQVRRANGLIRTVSTSSPQAPDFMKGQILDNKEHYTKKCFCLPEHFDYEEPPPKMKPVVNDTTGALATSYVVSRHSPGWMRSPLKANKEFMDKQGLRDDLRRVASKQGEGRIGGGKKQVNEGKNFTSARAPEWMAAACSGAQEYEAEKGKGKQRFPMAGLTSEQAPAWMVNYTSDPEPAAGTSQQPRAATTTPRRSPESSPVESKSARATTPRKPLEASPVQPKSARATTPRKPQEASPVEPKSAKATTPRRAPEASPVEPKSARATTPRRPQGSSPVEPKSARTDTPGGPARRGGVAALAQAASSNRSGSSGGNATPRGVRAAKESSKLAFSPAPR